MSVKSKCYRCGKEGGFFTSYSAYQASHCRAQNATICDGCLSEVRKGDRNHNFKCPVCRVGQMKSIY